MIIQNGKSEFAGCVFYAGEHNHYDDSDFYALVWDEASQSVLEVEYGSTRYGDCGKATVDITLQNLRKVYRFYYNQCRDFFDNAANPAQAKKVLVDDAVLVTRGRKIPKGTIGKAFWVGTRYNYYSRKNESRVGIEISETGERVFIPSEYVEVVGWESKLIRGNSRKEAIRKAAMDKIPYGLHNYLSRRWKTNERSLNVYSA